MSDGDMYQGKTPQEMDEMKKAMEEAAKKMDEQKQ